MVGRLVEEQHFRLGHQGAGERHAFHPAARERCDARLGLQPQRRERGVDAVLPLPAAFPLQRLLDGVEFGKERRLGSGRHVARQRLKPPQEIRRLAQPFGEHLGHRGLRREVRFLRHVGQTQARLAPQEPVVERLLAGEHAQQAGFARTVAPDQHHPLTLVELKGRGVEQRNVTKRKMGVVEAEHRHDKNLERESPRQESNLDLALRRRSFYPLNYGERGVIQRDGTSA